MALDPLDKQNENMPGAGLHGATETGTRQEIQEKIGDHPLEQAETLLSEPILIPRNPIAMNVRAILVVFISDLLFAAVVMLSIGAFSFLGFKFSFGTLVLFAVLLVAKFTVLMLVLVKMASNWSEHTYYLTERQLIHKRGLANVYEETYELANIRSVYMFQDFIGRLYDYGHVRLIMATRGVTEDVRLTDLKSPGHYKVLFEKYLG